jgi:arabinofuranan 3-O-arabinosyltransferase
VDGVGGEEEVRLVQPAGEFSPVTGLRLTAGDVSADLAVPPAGADGTSVLRLPEPLPAGPVTLTITAVDPRFTLDRRYAEPVELPAAIADVSVGARTLMPDYVDTGCRGDLLQIDGRAVLLRVFAEAAELLAGAPVEAMVCGDDAVALDAGVHRLTAPGMPGIHVDRVVLASGANPASVEPRPTATVISSDRLSRRVVVDDCPDGCWLVLGEGFHASWSARTDAGDLGDPQLVDGGFNGWWIAPSDGPTEVTLRWTAQWPLDVGLLLTVVAVLACIVLAAFDRRREPVAATAVAAVEFPGGREPRPVLVVTGLAWIVAALLLVGPRWALLAVAGAAALVAVGRPRAVGLVTAGIVSTIGAVIVSVVRDERPWPDAGWPARFEWLHRWGLFAAVTLLVTVAAGIGARRAAGRDSL